jgi:hypothetical protein
MFNSGENDTIQVSCYAGGPDSTSGASGWFDALKLEASTVVTAWTPGFVGKGVTMDAGGIMVDASPEGGATFRLQGSGGGGRDRIELGVNGLKFGGDIEMYSPSAGRITIKDNSPNNAEFAVGDDTTFFDADIADFVGIKSTSTSANGGFVFGSDKDTNLYRSAANTLATDDALKLTAADLLSDNTFDFFTLGSAAQQLKAKSILLSTSFADPTPNAAGIQFGADANLYRSAANVLKTDDTFTAGNIKVSGVTITPTADTITSSTVSGLSLTGSSFEGFVTANTTAIGDYTSTSLSVQGGAAIQWAGNSATSAGMIIYFLRANTTATGLSYMIWGLP